MARMLLVDDDDSLRKMLRITLVKMGHDVFEAPSGEDAIRQFRDVEPDVLITDLVMPGKEGFELIADLRRQRPAVRIIAISGAGRIVTTNYLRLARTYGADAVLAQPFSSEALSAV